MQACDTIRARSRELYAAEQEASAAHSRAVRNYAYGNGTFAENMATLHAVDAIWRELLALHGMTEAEWLETPQRVRRQLWGL